MIGYDDTLLGRLSCRYGHVEREVLVGVVLRHREHTLVDGRRAVVVDGDEHRNLVLAALEALVVVLVEGDAVSEGIAEVGCRLVQLRVARTVDSHVAHLHLLVGHVAVEAVDGVAVVQ